MTLDQPFLELLPSATIVRHRLGDALREVELLRGLLRLAERAESFRQSDRLLQTKRTPAPKEACAQVVQATRTDPRPTGAYAPLRQTAESGRESLRRIETGERGVGEKRTGLSSLYSQGAEADRDPLRVLDMSSPRRTQLEPRFIERGMLRLRKLRRAAVIEVIPWNGPSDPRPSQPVPNEPRDPLKLARYYQSLLDSGQLENRAALAR
jgi:hypothetical protein